MKEDDLVYYCDWAQQSDIHIVGIGLSEWTRPAWAHHQFTLPDGIYLAENRKCYTFNKDKVTAPESIGWLAYMNLKK
jgi:hypothetical protein